MKTETKKVLKGVLAAVALLLFCLWQNRDREPMPLDAAPVVASPQSEQDNVKEVCKLLHQQFDNTKLSDLTPKQIRLIGTCNQLGL